MKPSFTAGVYFDNKIWFSDNSFNALMTLDVESGECHYVNSFPGEEYNRKLIHRCGLVYNDKLIFTPNQGNSIHIYDTKNGCFENVAVEEKNHSRYSFSNAFVIDGKTWICPGGACFPFFVYDIDNKEKKTFYIGDILEKKYNVHCEGEEHFYMWILKDGALLSPLIRLGKIIKFDTKTNDVDVIEIKIKDVDSIYKTDERLFLCNSEKIYIWEMLNNDVSECVLEESNNKRFESESFRVYGNSNIGIYAFRTCGGGIYKLVNGTFKLFETKNSLKRTSGTIKGIWYDGNETIDNYVIIFPPYESDCYKLNEEKIEVINTWCSNLSEMKRLYFDESVQKEGIISLSDYLTLL